MASFNAIKAKSEYESLYGSSGNDSITVGYNYVYANGGAGDDVLALGHNSFWNPADLKGVTVTGGKGKDTIRVAPETHYTLSGNVTDFSKDDVLIYDEGNMFYGYDGQSLSYTVKNGNIIISDNKSVTHSGGDTITKTVTPRFSLTLQGVSDMSKIADAKFYRYNRYGEEIENTTLGKLFGISTADYEGDDGDEDEGSGSSSSGGSSSEGVSIKGTVLYVSSDFEDDTIKLSDYSSKLRHINASKVNDDLEIVGNSKNNSLIGGKGDDILWGNGGKDTMKGGSGNDIFVHTAGNDVIVDYTPNKDKIQLDEDLELTGSKISGNDIILQTTDGTITVKKAKGKKITIIDEDGEETSKIYGSTMPTGLSYNAKKTVLTASKKFTGDKIDLDDYESTVKTVNAKALTEGVEITGNKLGNSIVGGKGDDTLAGEKGNDTLTGGNGEDVFVYSEGNDLITDYQAGKDSIMLDDDVKIKSWKIKGKDVIFTTNEGKLTVKNGKGRKITIVDEDGEETTKKYTKSGSANISSSTSALWFDEENNFVTSDDLSSITKSDVTPSALEKITTTNYENLTQENNFVTYSEK